MENVGHLCVSVCVRAHACLLKPAGICDGGE